MTNKPHSSLRFKEFAKAAATGAFAGAVALHSATADAASKTHTTSNTGSVQINQANAKWFVNTNITFSSTSSQFGMSEASLHTAGGTRDDAYDGVLAWHVNAPGTGVTSANGYRSPGGTVAVTANSVTGTTQAIYGLNVSGELYFSSTKAVARSMIVLQNPTTAPITAEVGNFNNLGSDTNTYIYATSSGDQTFDATDNWTISYQQSTSSPPNPDLTADPVVTIAFQDAASSVRATSAGEVFQNGNDNPDFTYAVTIPAGATRRLLIFSQLSDTPENAAADAVKFNSAASLKTTDYLDGLSAQDLSEVVNWNLAAPAPTATVPTPTLSRWAEWMAAALLGVVGFAFTRRTRKNGR